MTPPLGSHYSGLSPVGQDAPPTMRADLLPDEHRAYCASCGQVTIWQIVCVDGRLLGQCETCAAPGGLEVDPQE